MNYYEHHLGDYAKDTGHLSMLEHGAYRILLDRYYSTERGIPADQAHRLARARSDEECRAVDVVLEEFFDLVDGTWIHRRVEREIVAANKRISAAQENGKKGGRPPKKPKCSDSETQQKPSGLSVGSDSETQQKAHQAPSTKHQAPEERTKGAKAAASTPAASRPEGADSPPPDGPPDDSPLRDPIQARAVEIVHLLRAKGCALQPSDPRVQAWANAGRSDAELLTALEIAERRRADAGNPQPVNAGYLDSILAGGTPRSRDSPGRRQTRAERRADWDEKMNAVIAAHAGQPRREIDMGAIDASSATR